MIAAAGVAQEREMLEAERRARAFLPLPRRRLPRGEHGGRLGTAEGRAQPGQRLFLARAHQRQLCMERGALPRAQLSSVPPTPAVAERLLMDGVLEFLMFLGALVMILGKVLEASE